MSDKAFGGAVLLVMIALFYALFTNGVQTGAFDPGSFIAGAALIAVVFGLIVVLAKVGNDG